MCKDVYYSGPWASQNENKSQCSGRVHAVLPIVFAESNLGGAKSTLIYPSKLHGTGNILDFSHVFCQR